MKMKTARLNNLSLTKDLGHYITVVLIAFNYDVFLPSIYEIMNELFAPICT